MQFAMMNNYQNFCMNGLLEPTSVLLQATILSKQARVAEYAAERRVAGLGGAVLGVPSSAATLRPSLRWISSNPAAHLAALF